jgi:hypothetical protein
MKRDRLPDIDVYYLLDQYYENLYDYPIFSTLAALQAGGEDGYSPHPPKLLADLTAIGVALSKLTKEEMHLVKRFYWGMRVIEECRLMRRVDSIYRIKCSRMYNGDKKFRRLKNLSGRYENKAMYASAEITKKKAFKRACAKISDYMREYDPRLYLLKI